MNTAKTEHTVVHRSLAAQPNRTDRAKEETWRNTRKLGSLLGDAEDVSRRKTLPTAALHRMWKLWLRPTNTKEATRTRLYNCFVLPILLYNCGTWALTRADLLSLEAFHRQQLPTRTDTELLRYHILRARWRLFGHILRRPPTIPAYRYILNYFGPSTSGGWKGRRRLTLPMVLDADLQTLSFGHRLQRAADLFLFRLCAQDRSGWRHLTGRLLDCTPTD
ncbi:hypothetical protein PHYSODRAFT_529902 [Phytophthora sojae]|uniref:Uncharacterized protein n=1 Tax=Phytophthora sojae (strain P6497) TaxID=1094619 RepID=G5AC22_PHYSP|nr:hypothetical protein PHYSODRAFT_530202 [Phytophthora sojae]XP_009537667.1 hypothetical protein PHYSODRAFT_529902 [Phytophthora sojae]EGZ06897.1 hypothetical protein PHYSODRAFT_530202 [Phytophthora sojae]EGZ06903.1 hypothetical protein PHYSODRAFT_529902 [Phytophthora sojae]|eukprot:XP_009537661.1 hypothetical protein PHYSODRAFT_530202 [Phytophthora sojae]